MCLFAAGSAASPKVDPVEWLQGAPPAAGELSSQAEVQQKRRPASPKDNISSSSSSSRATQCSAPVLHKLDTDGQPSADAAKREDGEAGDAAGKGSANSTNGKAGETGIKWREQQQQQVGSAAGTDASGSSFSSSGGGGWLGGRIRWAWERQGERQNAAASGQASKKSGSPSAAGGPLWDSSSAANVEGGAGQNTAESEITRRVPGGGPQGASPGGVRLQPGSSRSSSDATGPPSVLDPNWEAHADLIRAAFAQHLEQLCR